MAETGTTNELAPADAAQRIEQDGVDVVDVRNDEEYGAGRIAGARHIPFEELRERAAELDREHAVVFYCRSGNRSAAAADAFRASGWDASSISGGLVAWAETGLPLEPQDGEVAERSSLPGH